VVQAGLGRDLAGRQAGFPGPLEAFTAFGAGLVSLALRLLKRSLETPQAGSGLLLGGAHDCPAA
jgi:hypothetical protein